MKKTIAIILAVLMLAASMTLVFGVFAEDSATEICESCGKAHSKNEDGYCHCCVDCAYLDVTYLLGCAKDENGHFKGSYCCDKCSGIWPCNCNCGCEFCGTVDEETTTAMQPIIPEPARKNILDIFRNVMSKITEVFDRLFDAIYAIFQIED